MPGVVHTALALHTPGPALTFLPLLLPAWGDHSPLPILTCPCPHPAQVHGSRLRLPQVSSADSGEYVCRVENGPDSKEASITISVLHSTPSGGHAPGEEPGGLGRGRALGPPHWNQGRGLWSLRGKRAT